MAKNQTLKQHAHKKLCFIVADINFFMSHRLCLAKAAIANGWRVHVIAPASKSTIELDSLDIVVHTAAISRVSLNPIKNISAFINLCNILRKIQPHIVHNVALKPILLGSYAGLFTTKAKIINALSGLGFVFTEKTRKAFFVRGIIRACFYPIFKSQRVHVVVQNDDDATLAKEKLCAHHMIKIPGCVDTTFFTPQPEPKVPPIRLLFCARLLATKGLYELVEAFKLVKKSVEKIELLIAGDFDPLNPAAISPAQMHAWCKDPDIEYIGKVHDVRPLIAQSHIVVLPTYREGMPKSLLEAASMKKPIITCDVPGCREMIRNEFNGLLVPPRNIHELAHAIQELANNKKRRDTLAKNAHDFVKKNYDEPRIMAKFIALYNKNL